METPILEKLLKDGFIRVCSLTDKLIVYGKNTHRIVYDNQSDSISHEYECVCINKMRKDYDSNNL